MTRPKKIILIVIDTLRADHLGCYGYKRNTSPNIDALCKEGIRFKHAFSPSSFTMPSHGSIFTSKYPSNHSIGFNQGTGYLDTDMDITLAEVMRSRGYVTAGFVSAVVLRKSTNLSAGFDAYDDEMDGDGLKVGNEATRVGSETTRRALLWLEENKQKDFFLFIHYFDAHGPYICPEPNNTSFVNDEYYGTKSNNLSLVKDTHGIGGISPYQALPPKKESQIFTNDDGQPIVELLNGWHLVELWESIPTRWMGNKAYLAIHSAESRSYELIFRAISFQSVRTLEIYCNNELMEKVTISKTSFLDINITLNLKKGINAVLFRVPEGCERPAEQSELRSTDFRYLSVAFQGSFIKSMGYEKDLRYYIARYDGCINYCDSNIGLFLIKLKEWKIYDETLIIITSDHGEALGENNIFFTHGLSSTLDQISVPLIIKPHEEWDVQEGTIDTQVSTIDIMPTILSLCSYEYKDLGIEGNSLRKLIELKRDSLLNERTLMSEIEPQYALIKPNKLMELKKKNLPSITYSKIVPELIDRLDGKRYRWDSGKDLGIGLRLDPCEAPASFMIRDLTIKELGKLQLDLLLLWPHLKQILKNPLLIMQKAACVRQIIKQGGIEALKNRLVESHTQLTSEPELSPSVRACIKILEKPSKEKNYGQLHNLILRNRKKKLADFHITPPSRIALKDNDLVAQAESVQFEETIDPSVSIIIPVYNNIILTMECLTTIWMNSIGVSYEIIVIDDGSEDKTQEILSRIKNINYIRNPKNLGFLRSCNRAAEKARGEYILFLNNDVQVKEGWLASLLKTFSENQNVGAVGPKVLFPDGKLQEAGALIRSDCSTQLIGVFDDPRLPRYNYSREVDYCSGVCLLLQTERFHSLGGFDSSLAPAYCEDVELCLRLRSKGLRILYDPKAEIIHHLNATSNDIDASYKRDCTIRNQQNLSEKWQRQIDDLNRFRLIAFYLPQYHTIPENDLWWGKDFTEWTNVVKARPNFSGHYQPHLPSDGFYDLRDINIMEMQAELAKKYGIYGFCFYYYWFAGKRLLELPLERLLKTGKPDIPFCLCWANENWTRRWDGQDKEILIAQDHSDEDDEAVIRDLMRYMRHPNYIRIYGKPLLIVYRVTLFPDIKRTTKIWREICQKEGIGDIYLALVESFEHAREDVQPSDFGFDASIEFPPHEMFMPIKPPGKLMNPCYSGKISDYRVCVLRYLEKKIPGHTRFRTVMTSWDNTPRRQNDSYIFANASPGSYQAWLEAVLEISHEQNFGDERIVFINAWNEWAEGAHLEPDQRFGHGYLEATRNALDSSMLKTEGH